MLERRFVPTQEQREIVKLLAGYAIPADEIVKAIRNPLTKRPIATSTLIRCFEHELEVGRAQVSTLLAAGLTKRLRVNMRGVQVQIPDQAKQRLDELTVQRDLALDQTKALQNRINMADGASDSLIRDRLIVERDKQALRANHLQRLVSSCNQFLMQLRLVLGTALEVHPSLNLTIKTSLPAAVESTRRQIADLQKEIAKVRSAPLKVSSKRDAARAYLERLAQVYAPRLVFDGRGAAKATWREDMVVSKDEILSLIVWALGPNGPQELVEAFQIDEEPEPEGALTPLEKEETLGRFNKTLLTLERQENSLISCAAADGHEITRRPDANPMAVLNLVIVAQEPQQQVA
jgi:hypothetical protein